MIASTGTHAILAFVRSRVVQGHPMVPVITIQPLDTAAPDTQPLAFVDIAIDDSNANEFARTALVATAQYVNAEKQPKSTLSGNVDFQISRGRLGVSV